MSERNVGDDLIQGMENAVAAERAKPAGRAFLEGDVTMAAAEYQADIAAAYAQGYRAAERAKPAASDVDLMHRVNRGRPVIDGPQGVFMRWDAVMEALAEARREGAIAMRERALDALWQHCNDATDACAVVRALLPDNK